MIIYLTFTTTKIVYFLFKTPYHQVNIITGITNVYLSFCTVVFTLHNNDLYKIYAITQMKEHTIV